MKRKSCILSGDLTGQKSNTSNSDATGRKLRTSYKASASATAVPTDYCGNMIYENGVLKQILVDGGYIAFSGPAHYYYYYLKDHLGNNRVVVSPSGTPLQVNHYYPFGGLFGESTGNSLQRFRFNGKEFDRTHGLDWYDYGARHMTPDVGRFTTIDPMAEKYYSISPYAYCANNPVKYVDLHGDSIFVNYEGQEQLLEIINNIAGDEFFIDENGFLNHDDSKTQYVKNKSFYYIEQLKKGIASKNKISIMLSAEANYKGISIPLRDKGEGLTISDENSIYVYVSGEPNGNSNSSPEIVLAHELAGHAIPRAIYSSKYGTNYFGKAVTTENIIRSELGIQLRKWDGYANNDWSISFSK